jgi:anti-anti-sigma factor
MELAEYTPTAALAPPAYTPTAAVVLLAGDLDEWAVAKFADSIAHAIVETQRDIVVDLRAVDFLTSGVTRILFRTQTFLQYHDRQLNLRGPSPDTRLVLKHVGLADLIEPTTEGYGAGWPGTDD